MAATGTDPLQNENVTFIQHQLPGLPDSEYKLTVAQRITQVPDAAMAHDYRFAVMTDRFALSTPSTQVQSVFPADGATGEFTSALPHVVFFQPTLPWSRSPGGTESTGTDVATWLTVLLLDADDVVTNPSLVLTPQPATVGDLFPTTAYSGSGLSADTYSYFWQATDTTGLDPNQTTADLVQVLDIPLSLFWQIAPTIEDLALTAHVRQVSLVNKGSGQQPFAGVPVGTMSAVFGTRLPQMGSDGAGRKTCAYLVSLEGLAAFLPTDPQGGAPAGSNFTGTTLRLAVLQSWTFYTTGDSSGFSDRLEALNGRPAGSTSDAGMTMLQVPYAGTDTTTAAALAMGFVPMNESLRDGGQTVSWYRGPCIPYQNPAPPLTLPLSSADQATGFDPTTGMLDVSYSAAWTLGRMLALQDAAFSVALYNWKNGLSAAAVTAVEDELLAESFQPMLTAESAKKTTTTRALLAHTVKRLIAKEGR